MARHRMAGQMNTGEIVVAYTSIVRTEGDRIWFGEATADETVEGLLVSAWMEIDMGDGYWMCAPPQPQRRRVNGKLTFGETWFSIKDYEIYHDGT